MYTVTTDKPLGPLNSFGIRASARRFAEFADEASLRSFFADRRNSTEPWYLLSGGNNVLFSGDYPGTILHPVSRGIERIAERDGRVLVRAAGGEEWDDLVAWTVERGYGGLENLSLIPGYVGAAPVQNIGAYGAEAGEVIQEVECYLVDRDETVVFPREACRFAYRDSLFKHELQGRAVILSVTFSLPLEPVLRLDYGDLRARVEAAGEATLRGVREAVIAIRREKLPDPAVLGNAGSFFKNPVVSIEMLETLRHSYPDIPSYRVDEHRVKLAAGWLIERTGWKGARRGPVGVHERQALVLVNYGDATGAEVLALARAIQADVLRQFGVAIDSEVNIL